jgi:hypothetical protein
MPRKDHLIKSLKAKIDYSSRKAWQQSMGFRVKSVWV